MTREHTDRNLAHHTKVYNDLGKKHAIAISHESNNVQYTQQQQQQLCKNVILESQKNAKKLDGLRSIVSWKMESWRRRKLHPS